MSNLYHVFLKLPAPYNYVSCNYFKHDLQRFSRPKNLNETYDVLIVEMGTYHNKKSILQNIYLPLLTNSLYGEDSINFRHCGIDIFNKANKVLTEVFQLQESSILDNLTVFTPKETNGNNIFKYKMGFYIGHPSLIPSIVDRYDRSILYSYATCVYVHKYEDPNIFIPIEQLTNKIKRKSKNG